MKKLIFGIAIIILINSCSLKYTVDYSYLYPLHYLSDLNSLKEGSEYLHKGKIIIEKLELYFKTDISDKIEKTISKILREEYPKKAAKLKANTLSDFKSSVYFYPSFCCIPGIVYVATSAVAIDNITLLDLEVSKKYEEKKETKLKTTVKENVKADENENLKKDKKEEYVQKDKIKHEVVNKENNVNETIKEKQTNENAIELRELPKPIDTVKPSYPKKLIGKGPNGKCIVSVEIDEKGKIVNISYLHSLGELFDEEILKALKQWTFEPGKVNGKPAILSLTIYFLFDDYRFYRITY